ncbi:type I secretion system permease/ATPase [Aestuariivirga sp.]|uniref:type I secretion system permease/ATPase n=1 Tax=Aestuariivirga sp. TaxID=2650926 RepID=UPI0039E2E043
MARKSNGVATAAEKAAKSLGGIILFLMVVSGVINLLALTGSFYMMQIYDRAIPSQNVPTLLALSGLAIGLYLFQGLFETIRSQILVRVGASMDRKLGPLAHKVTIDMPRHGFSPSEALERSRDVDTIRGFLSSQAPMALFDLPWMPVYLVFVYLLHPYLGALVIGGAVVLAVLAIVAEIFTRRIASKAHRAMVLRNSLADSNARNAEVLHAMGFTGRAVERYQEANADHLDLMTGTSDVSGSLGAVSRALRMMMQSATLGLGAYLVIQGEMSAGSIIAASITSSRALAPVDLAIGNWKNIVGARGAWARIKESLASLENATKQMLLPIPKSDLKVEKLTVAAPTSGRVLLAEVSFDLKAGQALGVVGTSGGGKTTLVRALTGIWSPLRGSVRLDDADLSQWPASSVKSIVGYLPQDVSLIDGTIEENIARLEKDADPRAIVEAAQAAGIHSMIVRMPDGYKTQVGAGGHVLSAGQRQRVGLARALYGNPFLVVMDEPNSNLDSEGEQALTAAIQGIKSRGGIAIVVAHRPSALAAADLVAVIQNGKLAAFGTKDEILSPNKARNVQPMRPPVAANEEQDLRMQPVRVG